MIALGCARLFWVAEAAFLPAQGVKLLFNALAQVDKILSAELTPRVFTKIPLDINEPSKG